MKYKITSRIIKDLQWKVLTLLSTLQIMDMSSSITVKGGDPFQQSQIVDENITEIVHMHCQHCTSFIIRGIDRFNDERRGSHLLGCG